MWTFGAILMIMLVVQIVTGIVLAIALHGECRAGVFLGRAHHA